MEQDKECGTFWTALGDTGDSIAASVSNGRCLIMWHEETHENHLLYGLEQ